MGGNTQGVACTNRWFGVVLHDTPAVLHTASVCVARLIVAVAADDREESFLTYEEFHNFLKFGNTDKVSQFAKPLWDDGHRSCRSIASIKLKILEDRYGEDIRQCHSFCRLRIGIQTIMLLCVYKYLFGAVETVSAATTCFINNLGNPLKECMLQTWTHGLSYSKQRFQNQRCQQVRPALFRLSSPGHLTLISWKCLMLLWMFWHTLTACRPPRSGSRQLTPFTSQYVQSALPAVINNHMIRPLQHDAVCLSH